MGVHHSNAIVQQGPEHTMLCTVTMSVSPCSLVHHILSCAVNLLILAHVPGTIDPGKLLCIPTLRGNP